MTLETIRYDGKDVNVSWHHNTAAKPNIANIAIFYRVPEHPLFPDELNASKFIEVRNNVMPVWHEITGLTGYDAGAEIRLGESPLVWQLEFDALIRARVSNAYLEARTIGLLKMGVGVGNILSFVGFDLMTGEPHEPQCSTEHELYNTLEKTLAAEVAVS